MSDFFEMRQAMEKQLKTRKRYARAYQVYIAILLGGVLGAWSGVYKMEQPVGEVSKTHCVLKPCTTYTIALNK